MNDVNLEMLLLIQVKLVQRCAPASSLLDKILEKSGLQSGKGLKSIFNLKDALQSLNHKMSDNKSKLPE